jgi:hypothetical protein
VEEPVTPPIRLGLPRFLLPVKLIKVQPEHIRNTQITHIAADVVNVFHYFAWISAIFVKNLHTRVKILLGK